MLHGLITSTARRTRYGEYEFQGIIRNVTAQPRSRAALERMTEMLKRSNAELEQFAYVASYDLLGPLRKIRAFGNRLTGVLGDGLDDRRTDYTASHSLGGGAEKVQQQISTTEPRAREAERRLSDAQTEWTHICGILDETRNLRDMRDSFTAEERAMVLRYWVHSVLISVIRQPGRKRGHPRCVIVTPRKFPSSYFLGRTPAIPCST